MGPRTAECSPADAWEEASPPAEFIRTSLPRIHADTVAHCPVCDHDQHEVHAVGFDYELLTCANPWRFVRCRQCQHVWLNPRPAIETLAAIYPPTYYAYNYDKQVSPLAMRCKEWLDQSKIRTILRCLGEPPRSYLDVGCGNGRFLRAMEAQGIRREWNYGLELDENVVRSLVEAGYDVRCERVEDCTTIPNNRIDLVTMFHVIEHVADPRAVIEKIVQWMSPHGALAIETPNLDSCDARSFQQTYWGGYHFPRHWNLFTPLTLSRLLARSGLEVMHTSYQTGHSFWMYSFHHRLRYGTKPRPKLARWFDPFGGAPSLPFLAFFTVFDKLRASVGFPTSAMLIVARKKA